ncbi:MAG: M23 family metallopeptidase [Firmicutes bacterium]|nr:M23 family metallopeptidase [Bacillota bacterium]
MALRRAIWIIIYLLALAVASLVLEGDVTGYLTGLKKRVCQVKLSQVAQELPENLARWTAPWREEAVEVTSGPLFSAPIYGEVIATYGWQKHPLTKLPYFHRALDIFAEVGTPVRAVAPGRVSRVNYGVTLGHTVIIQHEAGWSSGYAHLSQTLAEEGDFVAQGTVVGKSGTSGLLRLGTKPHLHFILYYQDSPVDPAPWILLDQSRRSLQ